MVKPKPPVGGDATPRRGRRPDPSGLRAEEVGADAPLFWFRRLRSVWKSLRRLRQIPSLTHSFTHPLFPFSFFLLPFSYVPPNAPRFSTTRFSHVGLALPVVCAKPSRSGSEGHFPTFGVGFKIARPVSWSAIRRFIQLSKIEAPKGLVWDGRRTRFPLALAATCPLKS